jgi:hypothetical protein
MSVRQTSAVCVDLLQTSVIFHAGKTYAGWEGGPPTIVTVPDLQTQGYPKWYQDWERPVTAHPKVDPETNEMMFFGFDVPAPHAVYGVLSRKHNPLFQSIRGRDSCNQSALLATGFSSIGDLGVGVILGPFRPGILAETEAPDFSRSISRDLISVNLLF